MEYSEKYYRDLSRYLHYDFWVAMQAMAVLAGLIYEQTETKKFYKKDFLELADTDITKSSEFRSREEFDRNHVAMDLIDMWSHTFHPEEDENYDVYELHFSPEYFIDWALSKNFRPGWLDWAIERGLYKPKEQRQESKHLAPPTYSTSWLTIQQAAIGQFFNPRRNPDAKRDEIVEWIKQKAEATGLPDSNNIATTMFTIIKPANHDPKKKRVEPLD